MSKDGGSAFPEITSEPAYDPTGGTPYSYTYSYGGMTLHDYYVGKLMQGFCANPSIFAPNPMNGWSLVNCMDADLIGYARELADKMLKAREQ